MQNFLAFVAPDVANPTLAYVVGVSLAVTYTVMLLAVFLPDAVVNYRNHRR